MEPGTGAQPVDQLFAHLFADVELPPLHGEGYGSGDVGWDVSGAFVFAHEPPDRWLLERPPGHLRAVGDSHGEVAEGRGEPLRRVGVGVGWLIEPAGRLLRYSLGGREPDEQWRLIEPVTAEVVAGRDCWRYAVASRDCWQHAIAATRPSWMWVDAELPILLRYAAGAPDSDASSFYAEVTSLTVGSTGRLGPIWHPLLEDTRMALDSSIPAVQVLTRSVRDAIPEARDVEVLEWTADGAFLARFWVEMPRGSCNMLIDRRRYSQPPYELTSAHLIRTGGDGWCVSVDHGPELDERFRRTLGRRLEHQPIVVPELHD